MSKEHNKKPLKGDALVNKVALIVIEVISIALILGYISDFLVGNASIVYFVVFEIAAVLSAIIIPITYKKKPEKMKYIAFACFSLVYLIALYRPTIDLVFVMAFPIAIVFVLYYDYKLICIMAATFMAITVFDCFKIIFILKHHHSGLPINSSILLVEFLATGIFLGATIIVTKISKQNNDDKINTIQSVADKVNSSIKEINVEIGALNDSSVAAKHAMEEINSGITSTAEAVQHQLLQTEAIQGRIENVQESADKIEQNIALTMSAVATGHEDVSELVAQADRSVEISDRVIEDLNSLKTSMEATGSITRMIESIAFQINIMALNANVEAARAGDAGKGFAVVATEISNMSTKTKEATNNISELIGNATSSLDDLVKSVTEMAKVIQSEKEQTVQTSEIFGTIQNSTEEVREHVNLFIDYIHGLTDANREIVQSVSTISATTQEVTALTSEALSKERANAESVSSIAEQIGNLAQN